jgi:transposase-like protein
MPTYFDAATIERARVLVETTVRTLEDIAVELGTSVQTLRNWIKRYGWRRHPQAPRARPKLPPEKEGPARRIYESGAGVGDLAVVLDCHESYVHRLAKQRGWMRREAAFAPGEAEPAEPPSEAVMEIAAGFLDPHLTRGKLIRLIERLAAVTILEGLTGDVARLERRGAVLRLLVGAVKHFPEDPPPAPPELSPEEQERKNQAMIEDIVRRFESLADMEEPVDPCLAGGADTAA